MKKHTLFLSLALLCAQAPTFCESEADCSNVECVEALECTRCPECSHDSYADFVANLDKVTVEATDLTDEEKTVENPQIKMFSCGCSGCNTVVQYLEENGKVNAVVVLDVNDNEENLTALEAFSGDSECPFVVDEVNGKKLGKTRNILAYFKNLFEIA